jgi:hypothetical protein
MFPQINSSFFLLTYYPSWRLAIMLQIWHYISPLLIPTHQYCVQYRKQFHIINDHRHKLHLTYLSYRPRGKESTEVRITQNKGKESENSYRKSKSWMAILVMCSHTFALFWLWRTAVSIEIFWFCLRLCFHVPVHRALFNFW